MSYVLNFISSRVPRVSIAVSAAALALLIAITPTASSPAASSTRSEQGMLVAARSSASTNKTYQLYEKVNPRTDKVYVGRTSGTASPEENVKNRNYSHHMNEEGFGPAQIKYSSSTREAIRGAEQIIIEKYRNRKDSANKINSISPENPKRDIYLKAGKEMLKSSSVKRG